MNFVSVMSRPVTMEMTTNFIEKITQTTVDFHKSVRICHCLLLFSGKVPRSVFIPVSHFQFQFQPEDCVFFELPDTERLTSFKF